MISEPRFTIIKSEESNDFTGEWIWKNKRFGIYLDSDLTQCGWWAIKTDGTHYSKSFLDDPIMKEAIEKMLENENEM